MVFGKGKRGRKPNPNTAEADNSNTETLPASETGDVTPQRESFDTEAAKDGVEKAARRMKRDAELEAKYPHLVPGSIRAVPRGERVGDTVSKGRIAIITCVDCGAKREVNLQDVFQVRRCVTCAKANAQNKLAEKRAARATARKTREDEQRMEDDGVLP